MKKKKHQRSEEHENLDRWLVSYADFITLLFAFFVMLYAVTSMNKGKFRVLSNALEATLNHQKTATAPTFIIPKDTMPLPGRRAPQVKGALFHAMDILVERSSTRGDIKVLPAPDGTVLRIQSRFLFDSGHAAIRKRAIPVLQKIARILSKKHRRIHVRGYTDNQPIRTFRYPNNWALSSMRAVNVLVALVRMGGIPPERAEAVGFGKSRPIASNLNPEGRDENRRVEIFIARRTVHAPQTGLMKSGDQTGHLRF
ncbi:MAG: Putative flagellar motor protein (OmpA/MotB) [Leptospirillum sp. Group II 'C75']|jgi:chemotaxis protein MotB|uniref:flagellar motor protein MotB n=1 Tax=Leptospirillum sp. Group II 'CF-1' TaxID=1660083 RepID=UPI00029CC13A|nr:flagellar motor protein MotB [Leptospirillum sp. Group II 'CF-1']AKS22839.1 flagellar motor protein [Leptospirillum sp. Group II 'CF-1']EIJ75168.1 MAG: Putative flagellar motor protein (OmpA/MotB) [Leptospirillum sp. Group II 'C75']